MMYPVVWTDEAMFADPAVRLATGHGFTSTLWDSDDRFFTGYPPLYMLVLSAWLRLGTIAPEWERSLNYLLITMAGVGMFYGVSRMRLLRTPALRLALVLLVLLGYGMSMSFRGGRADTLMALLFVAALLASTISAPVARRRTIVLISILLPLCGLQVIVFGGVFLLLSAAFLPKARRPDLLSALAGLAGGSLLLLMIYYLNGAVSDLVWSTTEHVQHSVLQSIASGVPYRHQNNIPKDPSLILLMATGLLLVAAAAAAGTLAWRTPLVFGMTLAIAAPAVLIMVAKFPTYYSWMIYLPLATGVLSAWPRRPPPMLKAALIAGIVLACAAGLPFQLAFAAYDRGDRDYGPVREALAATIADDDTVFCDYAAYFVAVTRARAVYGPLYLETLSAAQRAAISLLIIDPDTEERVFRVLGDRWQRVRPTIQPRHAMLTKDLLGLDLNFGIFASKYRLQAYRRKSE